MAYNTLQALLVMNTIKKIFNLCLKFRIIYDRLQRDQGQPKIQQREGFLQEYTKLDSEFQQSAVSWYDLLAASHPLIGLPRDSAK